ncbi:MAG: type 2 isopentenyl-diphosphate Delta-isomerase, partial [Dehalococcoidia bacterium]|nr:type 2 isopentenyl-diphosphate Delta-isomerase [Dehalococcoidia bacterium]
MEEVTTASRKDDHIRINIEEDVQFKSISTGLDNLYFNHNALPELDFDDIDTNITLLGKKLSIPLFVSCMTGGTPKAGQINRILAEAAQRTGIGLGLGSMRVALEDSASLASFQLRDIAPDILLFANIGAVQLNYGVTIDDCRKLVELSGADAIVLHFNPLQEALQDEGQTNFSGLLDQVANLCTTLGSDGIHVVVKEVGWGFSEEPCRNLSDVGISAIDIAGSGGTSWSQVEMHRSSDSSSKRVSSDFSDWGISTLDALHNARRGAPKVTCIASGGSRNGVEVAKCLCLGATATGMAHPFLQAAMHSTERGLG